MELVRGIKITEYCDEKKLSTRERLGLFINACQAVQHAHQKGIIHRDLKPSNILVTVNDGVAVPKIIDFGIAKATQAELTEKTVFTRFHQFLGTPAYMSPEQAEMTSLDIDTRSDIYSLGVLLYETANGLASDIQHHLNNEPVVACPPSNLYKFQKLEHREVFSSLNNLAIALANQGKLSEAEAMMREALRMGGKLWGNEHPLIARSLYSLTAILRRQGKLPEAEAAGREALAPQRKLSGPEHPDVANALGNLARVLHGFSGATRRFSFLVR